MKFFICQYSSLCIISKRRYFSKMKKVILASLSVYFLLFLTSCTPIMMLTFGIKKPKKESNESVMTFIKEKNLDYDYVIRPVSDSAYIPVIKAISDGHLNGIQIFASNGDLLLNTNDTNCHLRVRSSLTEAIKSGNVPHAMQKDYNISQIVQSKTVCLNCKDGKGLFSQPLKRYIVVFGVAKFIPLKEKYTDIDYVQELTKAGLRDSVTVVLLSTDKLK